MIPDEAVEAALDAWGGCPVGMSPGAQITHILEAAIPFLADAAKQPQRNSPTDWPDIPKAQS